METIVSVVLEQVESGRQAREGGAFAFASGSKSRHAPAMRAKTKKNT